MGQCRYCGENAGLFRRHHQECERRHKEGWKEMISLSSNTAHGQDDAESLQSRLGEIASSSYVPAVRIREALIEGWTLAVDRALDDHVLSNEEEDQLVSFIRRFDLSQKEIDIEGAYTRLVKARVIRDVLNGEIKPMTYSPGSLPFHFQKSETLVWLFQNVNYHEQKVKRERVGGSQGVSFRVARGVYLRTGGFKSRSVERVVTEHVDTGLLGVTDKHLYFSGDQKKFRVPYAKIVTFDPYSDGIGIQRDAASAKPQTFVTGDGWFTYNLVTGLAQK